MKGLVLMFPVSREFDGMKGLGFASGGGREVEEIEPEESLVKEEDHSIDPDVDLSYIDVKLQDVLGHLQRDFEGGISVENLGAKFGGYGSFLPVYKRSPSILPQPGSPLKDPIRPVIRSPHVLSCEVADNKPLNHVNVSVIQNNHTLTKDLDLERSTRNDVSTTSTSNRNHIEDNDLFNKATKNSIQNNLKVRIKLGSDNILARSNAAIYSGLGLESSPSSSLEESPEGKKGILEDGISNVSPTTILQMMTGFPNSKGCFLSPLQEGLLKLAKEGDHIGGNPKGGLHDKSILDAFSLSGQLNSLPGCNESFREIAVNLPKENIQIGGNKSKKNDDKILEKKVGVETPEGKNPNLQTSSIPLLLNSGISESKLMARKIVSEIQEESAKGTKKTFHQQTESSRMLLDDNTFHSGPGNSNSFDSERSMESGDFFSLNKKVVSIKENPSPRLNLTRGDSVEKNMIFGKNALSCMQKECMDKSENNINLTVVELDEPKVYKDHIFENNDLTKLSNSQEIVKSPEIIDKSKVNASNATSITDLSESSMPYLSLLSGKEEKKIHAEDNVENKSKQPDSPKESLHDYFKQLQREVAWEGNGEVMVGRPELMVTTSVAKNRIIDVKIAKKKHKVRSVDDQSGSSLSSETPIKACLDAPIRDNTATDTAAVPAPIVIKDSWACCDLCEKWRLLPNGTNPDDLSKKWTCNMQFWLPVGMNHCTISEDETTKFMNTQCHSSLLAANSVLNDSALWTSSATVHENQVDCQIGSIIDTKCNKVRRLSNASMEKQKEKLKGKGKSFQRTSSEVGTKPSKDSKFIDKGLISSDISVTKKIKFNGLHLLNEDGKSIPDLTAKAASDLANGPSADFTVKQTGSVRDLQGNCSSLNGTVKGHLGVHTGKQFRQVGVIDVQTSDNSVIPVKKRKAIEWHDIQNNQETAMRSQHLGKKRAIHGDYTSTSAEKNENKYITSNCAAEYSSSKMTDAIDKSHDKARVTSRTAKLFIHGMVDNQAAAVQPSAEGNSSSLKLSSSCQNNANFQESRGKKRKERSYFIQKKILGISPVSKSRVLSPLNGAGNDHVKASFIPDGDKVRSAIGSNMLSCGIKGNALPIEGQINAVNPISSIPDHQNESFIDKNSLQNQEKMKEAVENDEDITSSHCKDKMVISESNKRLCLRDRNTSECEFNTNKMKLSNNFSEELNFSRNGKQQTPNQGPHLMSSKKPEGSEVYRSSETVGGLQDMDKLAKALDNKKVTQHGNLNREENEPVGQRPMRKCAASNAALMAMKEAKELKHAADRMKNLGQELEGIAIYFQAALKFLQAAFLSEPTNVLNLKYDELNKSLKTYTQTAALCEFCAREYEKRKDMVFAALAYKCMEVAYFKVAFYKNYIASKDNQELKATIQPFSQGDSPSSSAFDLDNLKQSGALENVTSAKVDNSPQNTSGDVITSRPCFARWLDFTNVSISAFEASRRSQNALSVASANLEKNGCDSIASVEEALNFNFHNVEELLRRIRAAMESFNH